MSDDQTPKTDFFGGMQALRDVPPELERQAVALSDEAGFTHQQLVREPPKRRRGTKLELHNFTMRLHMDDMAEFIRWCEQERIPYREGFQRLVRQITQT